VSPSVIAIDGPAASGKSTTARRIADRLGYEHLNSGLLYRAVAWGAREAGWAADPDAARQLTAPALERRVADLELELVPGPEGYDARVGSVRPGAALREPEVTALASALSSRAPVRERVTQIVRREALRRDVVCDGRDIGTVVFPRADLKVFLVAAPEERARRRLLERGEEPSGEAIGREASRLRARDHADASRALSPLRAAPDAVRLDTTSLTPDQVVDRILTEARRRGIRRHEV